MAYRRTKKNNLTRPQHRFGDPTIGHRYVAQFLQVLSGEVRTIEVVQFCGSDVWKIRIRETASIHSRARQQAEFSTAAGAQLELARMFGDYGLQLVRGWEQQNGRAATPAGEPTRPMGANDVYPQQQHI